MRVIRGGARLADRVPPWAAIVVLAGLLGGVIALASLSLILPMPDPPARQSYLSLATVGLLLTGAPCYSLVVLWRRLDRSRNDRFWHRLGAWCPLRGRWLCFGIQALLLPFVVMSVLCFVGMVCAVAVLAVGWGGGWGGGE